MASEFYGINRGQLDALDTKVVVGGATGATDFELRVDTGKGSTRKDVVLFLEQIRRYIMSGLINTPGIPPL